MKGYCSYSVSMGTQTKCQHVSLQLSKPKLTCKPLANQRALIYNEVLIILASKQKILSNTLHTISPYPSPTLLVLQGRFLHGFLVRTRVLAARFHFSPPLGTRNVLTSWLCLHRGSQTPAFSSASFAYLQRAGILVKPVYLSAALRKCGLQSGPPHDASHQSLGSYCIIMYFS